MNERVRELRKELGLTLEKFGDRLGVTKVAISLIEKGKNNVTDQMVKLICREFDVNEEWLRYGTGPKYKETDDEFAECVEDLLTEDNPLYDIIKSIMVTYKKLDDDSKTVLDTFIRSFLDNLRNEKNHDK